MLWGAIILCSRGPLLVAPATTLRVFRAIIKTNARTRILGTCLVLLGAPTIWAGGSEESTLAIILMFIGWASVGVGVPALVLFPRIYVAIADAILPADSNTDLFGWRLIGLVGVVIGPALFGAGLHTL